MTILVIDSDHLAYRAAASCSPTKTRPQQEELNIALWRLDAGVEQLKYQYNNPEMELYIGGEGNWRKAIYPEYKANRKDMPKPMWLEECRERLVVQYGAHIVNEIEADDMCGIRMNQLKDHPDKVVCCSLDKDLLQLPGYHYNWVKNVETLMSPIDSLRFFYKQIITGDLADHIPAFDGKFRSKQPKFVEALLEPIDGMNTEEEMYTHCVEIYSGDTDTMHRNASVLYLQTAEGSQWRIPGQTVE